jgi:hypothetical protein
MAANFPGQFLPFSAGFELFFRIFGRLATVHSGPTIISSWIFSIQGSGWPFQQSDSQSF